jgi:hypothetical protein
MKEKARNYIAGRFLVEFPRMIVEFGQFREIWRPIRHMKDKISFADSVCFRIFHFLKSVVDLSQQLVQLLLRRCCFIDRTSLCGSQ